MIASTGRSLIGGHFVLRAITALALAMCLAGCDSEDSSGGPVELLTGVDSCYAGGAGGTVGPLIADPDYGTRFNGKPAMWPLGYTGFRVGSEVAVVDAAGRVVATTGRRYYFSQAFVSKPENVKLMMSLGAVPVGYCGYAWSLIDCSAAVAVALPSCR